MSKLAIVTGGIKGIGSAISLALKEAGYKVVANYISNEEIAQKFAFENGINIMRWDVSDFNQCHNAIDKIEQEYGQTVEVLVNNAGITRDAMLHKMSDAQWGQVISTNLGSCFNMCHAVIAKMRENNFGRIVNITSVNALSGQMGQTNYTAAKAGMIGFSKSLARESALKNITVNCIAPGYIDTDMIKTIPPTILENIISQVPVKRLGRVDEIARMVVFLASPESGFITGQTISVNGGLNM